MRGDQHQGNFVGRTHLANLRCSRPSSNKIQSQLVVNQSKYLLLPAINGKTRNSGVSYGCFSKINFSSAASFTFVVFKISKTSTLDSILFFHQKCDSIFGTRFAQAINFFCNAAFAKARAVFKSGAVIKTMENFVAGFILPAGAWRFF
jgi:hypothetical protein